MLPGKELPSFSKLAIRDVLQIDIKNINEKHMLLHNVKTNEDTGEVTIKAVF